MKRIIKLIAEAGMLKRVPRSGWAVLGIKDAETVAEHSFRCAVIGYLLARIEGVEPYKVLLMTLFNDMPEARITDLHKMAQRYLNIEKAEESSFAGQVELLPQNMKKELAALRKEYKKQVTAASILARDADILECLIQAKEYYEQGFLQAKNFQKKAPRFLRSKSAKELWRVVKNTNLSHWWFKLGQFKR